MTSSPPSSNEANHEGMGSASSRDRLRSESSGEKPVLTPPGVRSLSSAYTAHLILLRKLDQAFDEQGILDPVTWTEVDAQILDCFEKGELSRGQYLQLHGHIKNRLRRAGGGWG